MENKLLRNSISTMMIIIMAASIFALPTLSDDGVFAAGKMKLNKKKVTISVGKTYKLKVKNKGKKKVTWKSSKKSVASVTKKGKIKAKKTGKATITAKVGKKKFKCKVTVVVAKGTQKNPAIATDGATVTTAKGKLSFKASILKNADAITALTSYNDWSSYDQRKYDGLIGTHDFVLLLFDCKAVSGFKGTNYMSGMDIFNSVRMYDGSCKNSVNYDVKFGGSSNTQYQSNTSLKLNGGQSGKMMMGIYVPKGTTSFSCPIYNKNWKHFWVKYNF